VLGASGLVTAARTDPTPLRIAISLRPALPCKLDPEMRAAAERAYTPPWNLTGQPAMTVPAGADAGGVPVGVQLVARPGDEATIVALAGQMERAAEE
jgi:Asp-tRNA(Asn)/Glu-tRNA(Gln) amidotransferase A subunit family amidase